MVVLSQPIIHDNLIRTCRKSFPNISTEIPVVDLSQPDAKTLIVDACKEFGFFKVINHGVSVEFLTKVEAEAVKFFKLPQMEKDKSGPPNPFGYGNKNIGQNGDVGWLEYLLFNTNSSLVSRNADAIFSRIPQTLRELINEYVGRVKKVTCHVLDLMSSELDLGSQDCLSRLVNDESSDCFFRLNHYPPWPATEHGETAGRNVIGFGEHTDPQIISVIRSNNIPGLQICLRDGSWVSVPPDHTSFFFNVGDSLQVMTNGKFMSVKHRVVSDGFESRVSMIFFGGPPLRMKIKPLTSLMADGEESLYEEFTWCEYKDSACKTRLGDNRLRRFQKY